MDDMAKILFVAGVACIALGAIVFVAGKIPGLGRLPGDIVLKKEQVTVYIPVMSCIILNFLLSLFLFLWHKR